MGSHNLYISGLLLLATGCGLPIGSNQGGQGPPSGDRIEFSPVGNYSYVPTISTRVVNAFKVDMNASSRMSGVGTTDVRPTSRIVFHSNHLYAYMAKELDPRRGPGAIAVYHFRADTGALEEIASETLPNYSFSDDLVISPDGRFLVAGVSGGQGPGRILIYSIHADTGLLSLLSNTPLQNASDAVRIRPDGRWLYSLDSYRSKMLVFSFDAETGAIALTQNLASADKPTDFQLHPSGKYAYLGSTTGTGLTVYALSDAGGFTVLETPPLDNSDLSSGFAESDLAAPGAYVSSIAVSQDGRYIYVNMPCYRVIHVLEVNEETGHLSPAERETDVNEDCVRGLTLTLTPDGRYAIVPTGETIEGATILYYSVNTRTGHLGRIGHQVWKN